MSTSLAQIRAWLQRQGLQTVLHARGAENPRDRLVVLLGMDHEDRPIDAIVEDLHGPGDLNDALDQAARNDQLRLLQVLSVFPFGIEAAHVIDVIRFVMLLNAKVELPGFGYDEVTRLLYFRHVRVCTQSVLPSEVESTLRLVRFMGEVFGPALEDLAQGRRTLEQVVADGARATG